MQLLLFFLLFFMGLIAMRQVWQIVLRDQLSGVGLTRPLSLCSPVAVCATLAGGPLNKAFTQA